MAAAKAAQERLDEIVIKKEFDVAEALSSIQFYWNLARQKGEIIIVEIWSNNKESEQCSQSSFKADDG